MVSISFMLFIHAHDLSHPVIEHLFQGVYLCGVFLFVFSR